MEKKYSRLLFGVLAMTLAWNFPAFTGLLFVGLAPLFFVLLSSKLSFRKSFVLAYVFILLWQLGSTFWLFRTNVLNVLLLNLLNSLLPALLIAWSVYWHTHKSRSRMVSYCSLLLAWISLEFVQHHWEMAFPLLTLGNGLGDWPIFIQWYEWTGVLGGSLWVLGTNVALTEWLLQRAQGTTLRQSQWGIMVSILVAPAFLSLLFLPFLSPSEGNEVNIVSVHPDMDCYTEKYERSAEAITQQHLELSLPALTAETDYLLWPETAVSDGGWTNTVTQDPLWLSLQETVVKYPNLKLVTGAVMYEPLSQKIGTDHPLIHYQSTTNTYFRTYNAAIQLEHGQAMQMRTKQQLVAFEETLPYAETLGFLDGVVPSLGKFAFSAARQNQHVFGAANGERVTPLICYETAFGESTASYVRKGAQLLMVILNEGWYQNYYGARQFMRLSQIRAIETRRAVARSSNFGATGFIDPAGHIVASTTAFEPEVLSSTLPLRKGITFYVRYGDYLGRFALAGFLLQVIWLVITRNRNKNSLRTGRASQKRKVRQQRRPAGLLSYTRLSKKGG